MRSINFGSHVIVRRFVHTPAPLDNQCEMSDFLTSECGSLQRAVIIDSCQNKLSDDMTVSRALVLTHSIVGFHMTSLKFKLKNYRS